MNAIWNLKVFGIINEQYYIAINYFTQKIKQRLKSNFSNKRKFNRGKYWILTYFLFVCYAVMRKWNLLNPCAFLSFQHKKVFCFQYCFDFLWEKKMFYWLKKLLKFEAKGREFAYFLRSKQFLKLNAFLTCSWRYLRSNTLEKSEFKLEKK